MQTKILLMHFSSFILILFLVDSLFISNNDHQIYILGYKEETVDSEMKIKNSSKIFENFQKILKEKNKLIIDLVSNNLRDKISDLTSILEFTGKLQSVKNLSSIDTLNYTIGTLHGVSDKEDLDKRNIAKDILNQFDDFQAISFIISNGDLYLAEPYERQLNAKSTNFSFRDYFKVAKETKSSYLSDIFTSSSAKLEQSAISVPIVSKDDLLIGIWSGLLNFSSINESLLNLNLTKERLIILDKNGNKMTDSQDQSDQTTYSHLISLISTNMEQKINTLITKINEKLTYVSYKPIELYGNLRIVFLLEPIDAIFDSLNQPISDNLQNYYLDSNQSNLINSLNYGKIKSQDSLNIGALITLNGSLASIGDYQIEAIKFAVQDFNKHFLKTNESSSAEKLNVILKNTDTNPVVALEKVKSLFHNDVKIIVGPVTSSELEHIRDFVDENMVLIISPGSTSTTLSIHSDTIFRIVPDDSQQAKIISQKMIDDGIKIIFPISRDDAYGNDLLNHTMTIFEEYGGEVGHEFNYDPLIFIQKNNSIYTRSDILKENLKIIDTTIQEIKNKTNSIKKIGIYLIAFDEIVPIFLEAQKYPNLSDVRWYGSDGSAKNENLINDQIASDFAVKTNFTSLFYNVENSTSKKIYDLESRIMTELNSTNPVPLDSYYYYDAVWLAGLASVYSEKNTNGYDIAYLADNFLDIAGSYNGITGNTILNEAGDRKYGSYDFWIVMTNVTNPELFYWEKLD